MKQRGGKGTVVLFSLISLLSIAGLTYFASRFTLRLPWFPPTMAGLRFAHVAACGLICLLTVVVKYPAGAFDSRALALVLVAQIGWFLLDMGRGVRPGRSAGQAG